MNHDNTHIQVKQATDIVQLISEHLRLVPAGKEFKGLCPFHDDKNPSMHVVPHKQFYKCFSCGASGDVYTFVMDFHKLTFPEAVEFLAKRAGVNLPERSKQSHRSDDQPSERKRISRANELAVAFFQRMFQSPQNGQTARDYVENRGISREMVDAFKIGYAPDAWDALANHVRQQRLDIQAFKMAGLISDRKSGDGAYDRLRHRLIFPICDGMGQVIAFGGRKLRDEDEPKYLNSPETALFNKSATLFGIDLAQRPIVNSRTAVIVEGYTDVIACHQAGVNNVVATLGTALTRDHARLLRRYADRVVMVFDPDEAGQKAADRGLEVFFKEAIDVNIAILPEGLDPADLLAKDDGMATWQHTMDHADDALAFQFNRVRRQFDGTTTLSGKQRIIEDYMRNLIRMGLNEIDIARRGLILSRLADILRIDLSSIDRLIRKFSGSAVRRSFDDERAVDDERREDEAHLVRQNGLTRACQTVLGCLLNAPALFHETMADGRPLCESIAADDFPNESLRRLYTHLSEYLHDHDVDEMSTLEIREVIEEEALLRPALNLKYEVDRLIDQSEFDYTHQILAAGEAIRAVRAERDYAEHKMQMQTDDDNDRTADSENQRLLLAVAHARAHPSARRSPRPHRSP